MGARLILTLGVLGLATAAAAQDLRDIDALTRPAPIAESVERLARNPTFRLTIVADEPVDLSLPWWMDREEARRSRPVGGTSYHEEYLRMVTPEAFRASTLNSGGVGVDPGAIINGIKSAYNSWQEDRVRRRVERELAEFIAAREAAQRRDELQR